MAHTKTPKSPSHPHSPGEHPSDMEHGLASVTVLWIMVLAICVVFGNAWAAEIVGMLIAGM